MTFPKRWLDDDEANGSVRDVLRAGRDMDPPDGAENAVWLALAAQIGAATAAAAGASKAAAGLSAKAAATAGAATGTAATGAVVGGGLLKAILIGALGGVLAVTGYSALEPSIAPPPAPSSLAAAAPAPTKDRPESAPPRGPAATAAPSAEPTPPPRSPAEPQQPSPSAQPSTAASSADSPGDASPATTVGPTGAAAPAPGSPEERESRAREESDILNRARTALRGGDTGGAMRLLEEARQKFPGGVLGQEREALAIETLAKSGARAEASARAAAFIKAHPTSPHAARLQVFVLP